jgi:hypothetical protein
MPIAPEEGQKQMSLLSLFQCFKCGCAEDTATKLLVGQCEAESEENEDDK